MKKLEAAAIVKKLETKVDRMIGQIGSKSPHFAGADGIYDDSSTDWWTSGFWPGILWVMYDMTGRSHYKEAAWLWDERLAQWFDAPSEGLHHDVGFQFLSTAVIKHTITGDPDGLRRGLQAANYLAGRFNPAGSFIRAWNGDAFGWAIVDCMMNISLLFWASRVTGDPRYRNIAIRHAETTMTYGVREDGSVKHILSFDPTTGDYLENLGGQGAAADSAWSRGTAWALNGFTNTYLNSGDERFLITAKRIAHFFIASLPDDYVPHWDFRLERFENEPRDSSASAIAASGLLTLADAVPAKEAHLYRNAALNILHSLSEHYATWESPGQEGILLHGTGHRPQQHFVDGSLIYGDYYYVEAIAKLNGAKHSLYVFGSGE
ncbi:unsaturated chondroitin disaccharide hydrolase [Paenibacillus phyllosphaerae]|uniref:Unsaturated chondroitin disaccharide hydrolase n=1 Tax=Paenibacillus phyllosphaerae TaxID=274593 RepID=A0A7W5AWJ3_9BACL|nr:glycoside hydrolase family 88 protein [Paenibacillus phyllosphaerae]MBB3109794.1 unsaturated chondroitin disaccharide hydrolase [Paenibacillus phyllosphaerae]